MTTCEISLIPQKFDAALNTAELYLDEDNAEEYTSGAPFLVSVRTTKKDIETGDPGKCRTCPVAKALLRALSKPGVFTPGTLVVQVYGSTALIARELGNGRIDVWTSRDNERVDQFVKAFDDYGSDHVGPFSITMSFRKVRLAALSREQGRADNY